MKILNTTIWLFVLSIEIFACRYIHIEESLYEMSSTETFWLSGTIVRRISDDSMLGHCKNIFPPTKFYIEPDPGSILAVDEVIVIEFYNRGSIYELDPVREPEDRQVGDRVFISANRWTHDTVHSEIKITFAPWKRNLFRQISDENSYLNGFSPFDDLCDDEEIALHQLLHQINEPVIPRIKNELARKLMIHPYYQGKGSSAYKGMLLTNHPLGTEAKINRLLWDHKQLLEKRKNSSIKVSD